MEYFETNTVHDTFLTLEKMWWRQKKLKFLLLDSNESKPIFFSIFLIQFEGQNILLKKTLITHIKLDFQKWNELFGCPNWLLLFSHFKLEIFHHNLCIFRVFPDLPINSNTLFSDLLFFVDLFKFKFWTNASVVRLFQERLQILDKKTQLFFANIGRPRDRAALIRTGLSPIFELTQRRN